MADTLAVDVRCTVDWLLQEAADLSTITDNSNLEYAETFTDGTSSDEADKIWYRESTLSGGGDDDWDLTSLSSSLFGGSLPISFAKIKLLFVVNTSTVAGDELHLSGGGAGPWSAPFLDSSDKVRVPADSCVLLVNRKSGWTVTNGASDTLRLHNASGSAVTYRIVLVGTSA